MRISKKILAIILSVLMAVSIMPISTMTAFADTITGGGASVNGFPGSAENPTPGDSPLFMFGGIPADYKVCRVNADYNSTYNSNYVGQTKDWYYVSIEEAVKASLPGDTIKLVQDIDFSTSETFAVPTTSGLTDKDISCVIELNDITLDLNEHTIKNNSCGAMFSCNNAVIKNGKIETVADQFNRSYGLAIWSKEFFTEDAADLCDNVVLEDLEVDGAISVLGHSNVVIDNCNVYGNKYYAVYLNYSSDVVIKDGTYTALCTSGNGVVGSFNVASYPSLDQTRYATSLLIKGGNYNVPTGKNAVLASSGPVTIMGGTYKKVDDSVYKVPVKYIAENFEQNLTTGEVVKVQANNGANMTVADTISDNIYIDEDYYTETYGDDVMLNITYNHTSNASQTPQIYTDELSFNQLPEFNNAASVYDGARVLSVLQAPAQATEDITIEVIDGGAVKDTITCSTFRYCESILEGDYDAGLKELAETTLDYAAAAQDYFEYNNVDPEQRATKKNDGNFYNAVDSVDFDGVASVSDPNALLKGASLVAKSDLEINLYSRYDLSVSSASIAADSADRFAVTTSVNGDYHCISIKGIEPVNMNKTITINTNLGTIKLTANAVMKAIAQNNEDGNLVNLAKYMYLYGASAVAYFE